MKRKRLLVLPLIACLLLGTLAFTACGKDLSDKVHYYFSMDTNVTVRIYDDFSDSDNEEKAEYFFKNVDETLDSIEGSISASVETSYVSKFNVAEPGETVMLDKTAYTALGIAMEIYKETDGYYNPGVYYSADLYRFATSRYSVEPYDREDPYSLPEDKYVTAFQELSEAFADVEVGIDENGKYYAVKPETTVEVDGVEYSLKIDLGGIGKGYAADYIDSLFDAYGYEYGYFFFGSSSIDVKKCSATRNKKWELTYEDPRGSVWGGDMYLKSYISDVGLSTSGDYEQYYEVDGQRYCHIIDSTTGSPIRTNILCCTVIGGSATYDDAYTTALMAMGLDKAVDFINTNLKDEKAVFVYESDGEYYVICNDWDFFTITNTDKFSKGNTVDKNGNIILSDDVN